MSSESHADLVKNQQSLNQADGYNQNHGDNMVRTFQTITKAVQLKQKQGSSDSAALAYAAKRLTKSSSSASAQLYAQGLSQAAAQFQGKQIDQRSGMQVSGMGGSKDRAQSTQLVVSSFLQALGAGSGQ